MLERSYEEKRNEKEGDMRSNCCFFIIVLEHLENMLARDITRGHCVICMKHFERRLLNA